MAWSGRSFVFTPTFFCHRHLPTWGLHRSHETGAYDLDNSSKERNRHQVVSVSISEHGRRPAASAFIMTAPPHAEAKPVLPDLRNHNFARTDGDDFARIAVIAPTLRQSA
jgi:hypothetical protein